MSDNVRREAVDLVVTGNFVQEMTAAAIATAALRRELAGMGGMMRSNLSVSQQTQQRVQTLTQAMNQGNAATQRQSQSINQLTGRLGLLADGLLTLGPAAIPIAAQVAPAIAGLATVTAAAAVAGGSLVLAFQGVVESSKALNDYALDPTAAGLEKARKEFDQLGPAAQRFVLAWQETRPVLAGIKEAAAQGWFPGLTQALDDAERLAPKIEKIVGAVSEMGGALVADGVDSLAGPRWADFLTFLETELPGALASTARATGDLTHGLSELMMSAAPGADRFLGWLEDVADGFDRWASSAEGRRDVEAFLDYAAEQGPKVRELFQALVDTFVAVVEAAQPVGDAVLPILTTMLQAVEAIASSDMGTPILAAVIAMRALSRATAAQAAMQSRFAATPFGQTRAANAAVVASGYTPGMMGPLTQQQSSALIAQQRAQAAQRRALMLGGTAAVAGGLLMSGAADKVNLTNTALLTMAGTMAGPWGAAAGAAAGLALDFSASLKQAGEQAKIFDKTLSDPSSTIADIAAARDAQIAARDSYLASANKSTDGVGNALGFMFGSPSQFLDSIGSIPPGIDLIDSRINDLNASAANAATTTFQLGDALTQIAFQLGDKGAFSDENGLSTLVPSTEKLSAIVTQIQPHMERMGVTLQDIAEMSPDQLDRFVADMVALGRAADRPQARLTALSGAFEDLTNKMLPASERAKVLQESLSSLLDPTLNAEAATDAWRTSLKTLREELDNDAGFKGFSEQAIANRELTRSYVQGVQQRLVALAEAGAGEGRMLTALRQSRSEFIASGRAAGLSAREIRRRANEMGLTPRMVKTIFETVGLVDSTVKAEATRKIYNSLSGRIQTEIALNGVPKTLGEALKIADRLDATAKERRALIRVAALQGDEAAEARLNQIARDRTATITVRTFGDGSRVSPGGREPAPSADGSTVPKDGRGYADRYLYLLAPGEEVISNRYGQADRNRQLLKAINAGRLADGGTVGRLAGGGTVTPGMDPAGAVGLFANALRMSTKAVLKDAQARSEAAQRARDEERQRLQALRSQKAQLVSAVSGGLTGSVFGGLGGDALIPTIGGTTGVGGSAKGEALERSRLIGALASRGMPLRLLGELGREASTEDLRTLVGYSTGALKDFTTEFQSNVDRSTAGGAIRSSLDDARRFLKALRRLRALGLRGPALADAASNASAAELEGLIAEGRAGVGEYVDLFNERDRIAQQAGQFAGSQVFDARIGEQVAAARAATRAAQEANRELRDLQREVRKASKEAREDANRQVRAVQTVTAELRGVSDSQRGRRGP